jgi:hypothetical protein
MTVVSSKEFVSNNDKYFDMALDEDVCIQRGNSIFQLIYRPVEMQHPEQSILEPDDNLRRAITAEELIKRIHEDKRRNFVYQK